MVEFGNAGLFKGKHLAACRIDAAQDRADGAVFPRGVHSLKYQQNGMVIVGVEYFLQIAQFFYLVCQELFQIFFAGYARWGCRWRGRQIKRLIRLNKVKTRYGSVHNGSAPEAVGGEFGYFFATTGKSVILRNGREVVTEEAASWSLIADDSETALFDAIDTSAA